jgi:hypothetical protein
VQSLQIRPYSRTGRVAQTDVPLFHPNQQEWAEHFAWNDDATEIMGLTPIGRATIAALKMNRPQIVNRAFKQSHFCAFERGPEELPSEAG